MIDTRAGLGSSTVTREKTVSWSSPPSGERQRVSRQMSVTLGPDSIPMKRNKEGSEAKGGRVFF